MRFTGLALAIGVTMLSACGGGADTSSTTKAAETSGAAPAAGGAVAALPITGTTHEVKMILDDKGAYLYVPADITVKMGDGVKFTSVSGPPHNVAFSESELPADVKAQLAANMPPHPTMPKMNDLSSPIFVNIGDEYTISFAGIKPGKYNFTCTPHLAMNMKGSVTVTP